MKTKLLTAIVSTFIIQISTFAQGVLTPPGAPAPTMHSLDQIYARTDARIPITNSASLVTISTPGSYYLTGNLTVSSGDGIDINTNGVTLDLSGYTIKSTAPSAGSIGIRLSSGLRNISIANGFIESGVTNNGSGVYSGSGFGNGISYSGNPPVNVHISNLSVVGCLAYGIYVSTGDSTVVEACTVRTMGSYGILASIIKQSTAIDCGSYAIYGDQVADCRGQCTGSSSGIYATSSTLNCYGVSATGDGLITTSAENCNGKSSGNGYGVNATTAVNCYGYSLGNNVGVSAVTAQNCYGSSSGGYGVNATTAQNCYGYNSAGGYGVYAGQIAIGCYGYCNSGTGISAFIANVCHGATGTGTALITSHNINSF